ncbi:restriction endonuclease [Thermophilibacter provencensis]|uniref:Restriction endonuclease n=1 Tax=Thermophilibacter provencensis TaxID=1852386 RepID=A0ABT7V4P6_9ACTN|nr:restriction endonuclease [Thermophilibacter provencensis]MDM8271573.1 restriction endonuclease [Thermophilibacter provencensis]
MDKRPWDSLVIKHADRAAYLMTKAYRELAPEYLKLLIIDVPLSCMPALREARHLAREILSGLDDCCSTFIADIRTAASRQSSGEDQRLFPVLDLDLDASRLAKLMEKNNKLYSRTKVRVKNVEEPAHEYECPDELIGSIDAMEGYEFERLCARLLEANRYKKVEVTSGSGDQGVDILCEKDRVTYAIQCKRYDSLVGNKAVQEVTAGRQFYHCNVGVVMTNSDFTASAKELAEATGVALWGRDVVLRMLSAMNKGSSSFIQAGE